MHGRAFCSEWEKMEFRMMDGPTSQGSSRTVKEPGKRPGEDSGATGGLKTSKKEVSPFKDLTDSDIAAHTQQHPGSRMWRAWRRASSRPRWGAVGITSVPCPGLWTTWTPRKREWDGKRKELARWMAGVDDRRGK